MPKNVPDDERVVYLLCLRRGLSGGYTYTKGGGRIYWGNGKPARGELHGRTDVLMDRMSDFLDGHLDDR